MPDFGLTKALSEAVQQGAKTAKVMRPGELEAAARETAAKAGKARRAAAPAAEPTLEPVAAPEVPAPGVNIDAEAAAVSPDAPPTVQATETVPPPAKEVPPSPTTPPPESIIPPDVPTQATRLSRANLGDYALDESHQPNFDTITTTDGTKAVIADLAEQNKARVDQARRGTITNEQLQGLANDLDTSEDVIKQVLTRETGSTLNTETIIAARQVVNSSADRIKTLGDKIAARQATDMEKIQFARQIQFHNDFYAQFMGARAEQGRGLNAYGIPVGSNEAVAKRIGEIIANTGGDIDRLARVVSMTDTTSGVTQSIRDGIWRRAARAGMNLINRNFVNGILSGPPTHIVNTMGNAIFQAMNMAETALAARLGRFLPGEEHVQVGEALASLHGTLGATRDAFRLAGKALWNGHTIDNIVKFDPGSTGQGTLSILPALDKPYLRRIVSGVYSLGRGINTVLEVPSRVLNAEDDFFKTLAYRADVQRQALLHVQAQLRAGTLKIEDAAQAAKDFMENTPEASQQASADWAREMTFQTPLGPTGSMLTAGLRKVPVLSLLAPFIRTPVNIFKQAAYRSPMAVFTARFWKDVSAGGRVRDLALTKFAMGSGTAAIVANYVADGNMTGGGPQDPKARQLWMEDGKRPYSIKVTNPVTREETWHSYGRLEPLASVLGATADAVEILSYINSDADVMSDEEHQTYQAAGSIIAGIMNNTGNKTFMKGTSDFIELMNDPQRNIQSYSNQFLASQVPYSALLRYVRNTQDPYLREAWTLLDKVKDNIPGYSTDLGLRLDLFGEPREKNSSTLMGTMSPMPESPQRYDNVVSELANVMSQTQTVPVTMPEKRIEGMRLQAKEYSDLVTKARHDPVFGSKTFHDQLEETMNSSVYAAATPTMRGELLKHIQSQADNIGTVRLEKDNPEYAERIATWRMQKNRLKFGQ